MRIPLPRAERRVILLVGVLGMAVLWVYAAFLVRPLGRELRRVRQQLEDARKQLNTLELVTVNVSVLRRQVERLDGEVVSLKGILPTEAELPSLLEYLSELAAQSQLKIQAVSPQRVTEKAPTRRGAKETTRGRAAAPPPPPAYKTVLIHVDALAGYHQLGTFLSLAESGRRPLHISTLRITANPKEPKRHQVKLLLRSYLASGEASAGTGPGVAAASSPGVVPAR